MKKLTLYLIILIFVLWGCDSKEENPFELPDDNWGPKELQLERLNPTSVKLVWEDRSSFEMGFVIDKSDNYNTWMEGYQILASNTTTYIDSFVDWSWDRVYYRVKAYYEQEYSEPSVRMSLEISNTSPSNLSAHMQKKFSIKINWNDNSNGEDNFILDTFIPGIGWQNDYLTLLSNSSEVIIDNQNLFGRYRLWATHNNLISAYTESQLIIDSLIVAIYDTYCANDIFVKDNYAYIADDMEGLKILDVNNVLS